MLRNLHLADLVFVERFNKEWQKVQQKKWPGFFHNFKQVCCQADNNNSASNNN